MKNRNITISFKARPWQLAGRIQEVIDGPAEESAEPQPRNLIEEQMLLRRAAAWRHMFKDEPPIFMN